MARVCVIGGGPAGSSFATRMARLGHEVVLVERSAFPRRHLGESLTPGVLPLLEATGARDAVEAAGFPRPREVEVRWNEGERLREDPRAAGMLVDRGVFDALLLDRARADGVRVLQPASLAACRREGPGWILDVDADGCRTTIACEFLADARARAGGARGARRRTGPSRRSTPRRISTPTRSRRTRSGWAMRRSRSTRSPRAACRRRSRARSPAPSSPTRSCAAPTTRRRRSRSTATCSPRPRDATRAGPPDTTPPSPEGSATRSGAHAPAPAPRTTCPARRPARWTRRRSGARGSWRHPNLRVVEQPCLDADFVVARRAVAHPGLDGPVAYLGGQEVAPLLDDMAPGLTALELARAWQGRMPPRAGLATAAWMVERGLLLREDEAGGARA